MKKMFLLTILLMYGTALAAMERMEGVHYVTAAPDVIEKRSMYMKNIAIGGACPSEKIYEIVLCLSEIVNTAFRGVLYSKLNKNDEGAVKSAAGYTALADIITAGIKILSWYQHPAFGEGYIEKGWALLIGVASTIPNIFDAIRALVIKRHATSMTSVGFCTNINKNLLSLLLTEKMFHLAGKLGRILDLKKMDPIRNDWNAYLDTKSNWLAFCNEVDSLSTDGLAPDCIYPARWQIILRALSWTLCIARGIYETHLIKKYTSANR